MIPTIIISNSQEYTEHFLEELKKKEGIADYHFAEFCEVPFKIEHARLAKPKLESLSYLPHKFLFFIKNIDKATKEAQNALLKSIEEPPENALIVLSAGSLSGILETIVSRCKITYPVQVPNLPGKIQHKTILNKIHRGEINVGEAISESDEISSSKEKTLEYLIFMLEESAEIMRENLHIKGRTLWPVKIQSAVNLINLNLNHRLVFDNLLISLILN